MRRMVAMQRRVVNARGTIGFNGRSREWVVEPNLKNGLLPSLSMRAFPANPLAKPGATRDVIRK